MQYDTGPDGPDFPIIYGNTVDYIDGILYMYLNLKFYNKSVDYIDGISYIYLILQ